MAGVEITICGAGVLALLSGNTQHLKRQKI
jgi:hypothetical protein